MDHRPLNLTETIRITRATIMSLQKFLLYVSWIMLIDSVDGFPQEILDIARCAMRKEQDCGKLMDVPECFLDVNKNIYRPCYDICYSTASYVLRDCMALCPGYISKYCTNSTQPIDKVESGENNNLFYLLLILLGPVLLFFGLKYGRRFGNNFRTVNETGGDASVPLTTNIWLGADNAPGGKAEARADMTPPQLSSHINPDDINVSGSCTTSALCDINSPQPTYCINPGENSATRFNTSAAIAEVMPQGPTPSVSSEPNDVLSSSSTGVIAYLVIAGITSPQTSCISQEINNGPSINSISADMISPQPFPHISPEMSNAPSNSSISTADDVTSPHHAPHISNNTPSSAYTIAIKERSSPQPSSSTIPEENNALSNITTGPLASVALSQFSFNSVPQQVTEDPCDPKFCRFPY